MTAFLLSIMFFLTSCADNSTVKQKNGDRLLEDPKHYIKDSHDILKHDSTMLYTGWYYVVDTPNGYRRQVDKSDEIYYLDPRPIVTAKNIKTFEIYENWLNNKQYFVLIMQLDKEGIENWSNATQIAIMKKLAFIVDNRLLQVPTISSQITDGVTILSRGDYSRQEVENFKRIIESEK